MPKKLRKPVEQVRQELLADPTMTSMAKKLAMTTEAYVELVLDYAQHPEKTPTFNVLPDAEVKARGGSTLQDVQEWFKKVARGEIRIGPKGYHDGFDPPRPTQPGAIKKP
jgi:hypothetical protein